MGNPPVPVPQTCLAVASRRLPSVISAPDPSPPRQQPAPGKAWRLCSRCIVTVRPRRDSTQHRQLRPVFAATALLADASSFTRGRPVELPGPPGHADDRARKRCRSKSPPSSPISELPVEAPTDNVAPQGHRNNLRIVSSKWHDNSRDAGATLRRNALANESGLYGACNSPVNFERMHAPNRGARRLPAPRQPPGMIGLFTAPGPFLPPQSNTPPGAKARPCFPRADTSLEWRSSTVCRIRL